MELSLDPYEQKLFQMFKSHDITNKGLDETSLIKLCNSLELSDQSDILVKSLISKTDKNFRVDFKSFKEALLNFLGTEMEGSTEVEEDRKMCLKCETLLESEDSGEYDFLIEDLIDYFDKALTLTDDENKTSEKIINNGPDSPGREVSPKLIMGAKKYGRRSRPQSIATDSSLSETDEEIGVKSNRVQRSSSHSDMHNTNVNRSRRRPANATNTKLKRCASLPVQKRNFHAKTYAKDQQQQQQTKLQPQSITVNVDGKEQKQLTSSVESLGNIDFDNLSYTINEIWLSYTNEKYNDNDTNENNCLKRDQLESLCERIGLFHNVAGKMADEIFEKLNLNPKIDKISFDEFIGLIHGADTESEFTSTNNDTFIGTTSFFNSQETYGTNLLNNNKININNNKNKNNGSSITTTTNFDFNYNPIEVHNNTQDSLCTLVDTTTANNRDLHIQDIPMQLETVPFNSIIEMWENSLVQEPKMLLSNLGFGDDEINVGQLIKVLEDDLNGLQNEKIQKNLLKALLALEKAEVTALQQSFKLLCEENKKLHSDNKDANKRAALLALEIDERHANLEDSTKTEIRLLEQRHAEVIRDLTIQISSDRENWSNLNARLENRIKSLEQEDQRLKSDMQSLQDENSALEKDQTTLQKQITDLLETNIKLNNEIMSIADKNSIDNEGLRESDELLELVEKIRSLQIENTNLRDKNDELTAELENINHELVKLKMSLKKSSRSSVLNDSTNEILSDDAEHASSLAMKRRGDSPSKAKLTEESPRTGKLRKCNNDGANNSESETSGDWVALNSELSANALNGATNATSSGFSQDFSSINTNDIVKDDEIKALKDKILKLEQELTELKNKNNENQTTPVKTEKKDIEIVEKLKSEKENAESRCKDLENSLDQMRKAYEDCEDYWQNKLNDERQIFEKERQIYEDEQSESDKKFAELMDKVHEYEEQYSKDGRLSPIEEKDVLEQQYMDLETEIEEIRHNAKLIFEEKTKEIDNLKMNIQELKLRLGDSVDITQVCMESTQMITDKADVVDSPASSPISYLWNQSTIQAPARDYQNPNWNKKNTGEVSRIENLSTSETSIFSTPVPKAENEIENENSQQSQNLSSSSTSNNNTINPIQKPISSTASVKSNRSDKDGEDSASIASGKSYETHSVASTHSLHKSSILEVSGSSSPNGIKEELKRLKFFEVQLREQIKDLALKRDSLVMELQQLQEAKPVLEKAYARAAHPTLIQRVNLLEQKNRHLQTQLRQHQQYTDSILQQTWQQQRSEVADLRNRIETQAIVMAEQAQRLTNSDMLVKDLYVENSHLSATIQRLEQQRSRANIIHQHQQKHPPGFSGVPGMP